MNDYSKIDPDWAWSDYSPSAAGTTWDLRRASHLYRRAGFGADYATLHDALSRSPAEIVDGWLNLATPEFAKQMDGVAKSVVATNSTEGLAAWWAYRMLHTPRQLTEKLTLFWHGHFATSVAKVENVRLMLDQNETLRSHASGDFRALVQAISRDPAMLIYLDSNTNRKAHPNENYARELMELFCLGEGQYTEQDIRELAKCFTGWEIRRDKFRFNRRQHDSGEKSFLGHTGAFSGEGAVHVVMQHQATPEFIVGKLVNFFVFDEPSPPATLIAPLVRQFRADDLNLHSVLRRILTSNLFYSHYAVGRKIRSPAELCIGLPRCLQATADMFLLSAGMAAAGQELFQPPNVKGWPGGRAWINSSTLLARSNLVTRLVGHERTKFTAGSINDLLDSHNLDNAEQLIDWLSVLLLPVDIHEDARRTLASLWKESRDDRQLAFKHVVSTLSTLPEFQLA